jgi:UDP-N-acetylglucosamine acyltransferase
MEGARIGKNCSIFWVQLSLLFQDLKFGGEESTIIGDNCTIRECVTINRGIASGQTTFGNNCLIMATAYCA